MKIPFYKPSLGADEFHEVLGTLESGWLTTGPRTKQFETDFGAFVHQKHAVALNSCTAALHLALEAVGVKAGHSVLVPTMTFAATAEVIRYFGARPLLVDCRVPDFNLDVADAERRIQAARAAGQFVPVIMPVHYGGQVGDVAGIRDLARRFDLKIVEDAAHCCPAYYRNAAPLPGVADTGRWMPNSGNGFAAPGVGAAPVGYAETAWQPVGASADITCFSFYANKCITTGEGGMACSHKDEYAERMRIMSLHGISRDAWKRYTAEGSWYYEIIAPGYKYNMTDIAAAIGIHQLRKADLFHRRRAELATQYSEQLRGVEEIILPRVQLNRIHSWHLYVIRLRLSHLSIDRAQFITELKRRGIGTSVHWMPLHLHPYYQQTYGYTPQDLPTASELYPELVSLPLYPGLTETDVKYVCNSIQEIVAGNLRHPLRATQQQSSSCVTRS